MKKFPIILIVLLLSSFYSNAQLEIGAKAPSFEATDDEGNTWSSDKYIGKSVLVVYFYPAAMTGGCTKQACSFRDDKTQLEEMGATVIGVSGDEVENLKYFKEAHDLNFTLLSDPEGTIARKFGVPMKEGGSIVRSIGGSDITLQRGVTTSRWTFIVDKDGSVVYKNTEVNAQEDSKNVIEALQNL
jgi:peroxiredoxin Q/BCP